MEGGCGTRPLRCAPLCFGGRRRGRPACARSDRVRASGAEWLPTAGASGFSTRSEQLGGLAFDCRHDARDVVGVDEVTVASRPAPLAVWEGAGTGSARAGLLRAHPLLRDGVLTGPVFGRRLARATLEYARPRGNHAGGHTSSPGSLMRPSLASQSEPAAVAAVRRSWSGSAGAGARPRWKTIRIDFAHGCAAGAQVFRRVAEPPGRSESRQREVLFGTAPGSFTAHDDLGRNRWEK